MKYEIETLKNGQEVIFVNLPGSTAASAQIWFRAGSTFEDKSNFFLMNFVLVFAPFLVMFALVKWLSVIMKEKNIH